jgi:hypothetical protein
MALRAIQPGGSGVWCMSAWYWGHYGAEGNTAWGHGVWCMSAWFAVDVDESVRWEVYSVWCTVPGDISASTASTASTASVFSYSTWGHLC